jgi:CDP-paratose 2-epimerase
LQVRDILHVDDLYDLLICQLADIETHKGYVYNVGGGLSVSVSLAELTRACSIHTRREVAISSQLETRAVDIPYYMTDNTAVTNATGWRPSRSVNTILDDIFRWLIDNRRQLEPILANF